MPKMKTKKAASKRFKVRSGGSIKRAHATKRHILSHRTIKNKRHLRGMFTIHDSDTKSIHRMLPYAKLRGEKDAQSKTWCYRSRSS